MHELLSVAPVDELLHETVDDFNVLMRCLCKSGGVRYAWTYLSGRRVRWPELAGFGDFLRMENYGRSNNSILIPAMF